MANKGSRKNTISGGRYVVVIALSLTCFICVWGAKRYEASSSTNKRYAFRSSQRQASRVLAHLRVKNRDFNQQASGGCFASSEDEARNKLMESIRAADPDNWSATMDPSSVIPSASMYVCTEGLSEEEAAGMNKVLYASTQIKPRIRVEAVAENELDPKRAHAILQSYLGRDRYLEQVAKCFDNSNVEDRMADAQIDTMVAGLLNLSAEQRTALEPITAKLRALPVRNPMQVLDEHGEIVGLSPSPDTDAVREWQTLLPIADEGFAILTAEQARKYKDLVTQPSYGTILSQFQFTQRFLPIPDEIRANLADYAEREHGE